MPDSCHEHRGVCHECEAEEYHFNRRSLPFANMLKHGRDKYALSDLNKGRPALPVIELPHKACNYWIPLPKKLKLDS